MRPLFFYIHSFCICEIVLWVSLDIRASMKGLSRTHDKVCMQLWGFGKHYIFLKPQSGLPLLCCGRQNMVSLHAGYFKWVFYAV